MNDRPPFLASLRPAIRVLALVGAAWLFPAVAAEPAGSLRNVVVTNYVWITNIVVVTNYVVAAQGHPVTNTVPAADPSKSALPDLAWVPPEDGFDWIQLKSGEWLKGRIRAMQDRQLVFDSEELDDLSFDWKDIRQLRSPQTLDLLFVGGEKISGSVAMSPGKVGVGGAEPRAVSLDQVQSLTPGGPKERNYWSGKVSAGLTVRAGNSEQVEYNAQAHLQRHTPATRLSLDYIGNVSSADAIEIANNHRVNTEFDLWLSRRFYLVLPSAEYYKDPFQNLAHRVTFGLGIGYDLVDRPKVEWNITTGPAFQQAWFESSEAGGPRQKGAAAITFGSRFKWDITHRIKWISEYRGQYTSRQVGETTHHGVSTMSLEVTKRFELDLSFVWDRISNPKIGADGFEPFPDDYRLVVGLGIDF